MNGRVTNQRYTLSFKVLQNSFTCTAPKPTIRTPKILTLMDNKKLIHLSLLNKWPKMDIFQYLMVIRK